jgi:hypothetical protein
VPQSRTSKSCSPPAMPSQRSRALRGCVVEEAVSGGAPDIVKAAIEGRLPRGFGLKRLVELPMAWPHQWRTLGLQAPAQA